MEFSLTKNNDLQGETGRLKNIINDKSEEVERLKNKNSQLEFFLVEAKGKENRLNEYENKIALLTAEIERLSNGLKASEDMVKIYYSF